MDESVPDDVDLGRVWIGVAAQVWRRRPGRLEQLATRLLGSPGLARALLTTTSLLPAWLIASLAVFLAGSAATAGTGQPVVALIAPAVAGAGIAFAYGPGADPAWELSLSTAVGHRMVLLVRVLAVFAINAVLGLVASLAAGTASGLALGIELGWLAPMTAVSALALAIATVAGSPTLGAVAGLAAWAMAILGGQTADGQLSAAVSQSSFLLPYLICAACCGVIVVYATRMTRGSI